MRLFGDRAYVVTARMIDPLYVIDMSDPIEPFIAGELEVPGIATQLQLLSRKPECCGRRDAQLQLLGRKPECCGRRDAQEQPLAAEGADLLFSIGRQLRKTARPKA